MPKVLKVDLWFWQLDASAAQLARWHTILDAAEQARMARFMFDKDKTRFVICRSRLRRILGWYTHCEPRGIQFATTGRNKPILASNPHNIAFNLTHTEGLACLAIAHHDAIGVDLEQLREIKDDFIAYALNPTEVRSVHAAAGAADRQHAFFRYWTAKEAYLKAIGTGLWQSLKTFDVDVPITSPSGEMAEGRLPRIDDATQRLDGMRIFTFQATEKHIGALAIGTTGGEQLEFRSRWIRPLEPGR